MKKVYELVNMSKAKDEETVETLYIKVSLLSFGAVVHILTVKVSESSFSRQGPADCTVRLKFNPYKLMFL